MYSQSSIPSCGGEAIPWQYVPRSCISAPVKMSFIPRHISPKCYTAISTKQGVVPVNAVPLSREISPRSLLHLDICFRIVLIWVLFFTFSFIFNIK